MTDLVTRTVKTPAMGRDMVALWVAVGVPPKSDNLVDGLWREIVEAVADKGTGSAPTDRARSLRGILGALAPDTADATCAEILGYAGVPAADGHRKAPHRSTAPSAPTVLTAPAEPVEEADLWPEPPGPPAFRGLAGRIVATAEPHTEADPVALLFNVLVLFGCAVGAGPHVLVGATRHPARHFVVDVGETSTGKKGEALAPVRLLFELALPEFKDRIKGGLASGEGLIAAVRDATYKTEAIRDDGEITGYRQVMTDAGVEDKRLLDVEPEFARVLKVMARQGNIVSEIIRTAWDSGDLNVMTKAEQKATGAHICTMNHITPTELRRELTDVSLANGFANRMYWVACRQSKLLPRPAPFGGETVQRLATELRQAVANARAIGPVAWSDDAGALWDDTYPDLVRQRRGLVGAVLARAAPMVLRLALTYTLLDGEQEIAVDHLVAALELWAYCERSASFLFGQMTGDPVADAIHAALARNGAMMRSQFVDLFQRHENAPRISSALQLLLSLGKARSEMRPSNGGRDAEWWLPVR